MHTLKICSLMLCSDMRAIEVCASVKCIGYFPDSKVHGTIVGPIWSRQDLGGPHVGSVNFAIWVGIRNRTFVLLLFIWEMAMGAYTIMICQIFDMHFEYWNF